MDFACFFSYLQLDLQLQDEAGGDISSFITNGEWDLLGKQCATDGWITLGCISTACRRLKSIKSSKLKQKMTDIFNALLVLFLLKTGMNKYSGEQK